MRIGSSARGLRSRSTRRAFDTPVLAAHDWRTRRIGSSDGTTRTSERDSRHRVIAPGTEKMIAANPTAATANIVAGGIRNSVAVGGVVKATVKNATAHSGIASLR